MKIASNKFAIIHDIINTPGNVLRIDELCKTAGVSRSGYYNWLKSEDKRKEKDMQDRKDFELILEAFKHRGYDKGIRRHPHEAAAYGPTGSYECQKNSTFNEKIWLVVPNKKS